MGGGALARIRPTRTSRPQLRDSRSPLLNSPEVKRSRLGRKSWEEEEDKSEPGRERERREEAGSRTHLFKLFHGEHLFGELQQQILPQ